MIQLEFKADGGAEVKKALKTIPENMRKRVLKSALNSTAKEALNVIWAETQKKYSAKKHIFKSSKNKKIDIIRATTRRLETTIKIKSKKTELYEYKVSPSKYEPKERPEIYRAKVLLSSSLKSIYKNGQKAFLIQYASGHKTLAYRVGDKRYPVHNVWSPAISQLVGAFRMQKILYPEINKILKGEVHKQMVKLLNKRAKK